VSRICNLSIAQGQLSGEIDVDSAAERVALQLPPRRALSESAKIAAISRAEGGQLQAPVGRRVVSRWYRLPQQPSSTFLLP